jgi:DNA gyrase subunit A
VLVTRNGRIKRVAMSEFASVRPSGLIAANLEPGDVLGWAKMTDGRQSLILVTEQGQALRYAEGKVRAMGRQAAGVNAIHLAEGDHLVSMDIVAEGCDLMVVSQNGFGKRTPLPAYPAKGRATRGIATIAKAGLGLTGKIVAARVVHPDDELTLITTFGQAIRMRVRHVRQTGRSAMGTRLISLKNGDTVASMARLAAADIAPREGEAGPERPGAPAGTSLALPEAGANGAAAQGGDGAGPDGAASALPEEDEALLIDDAEALAELEGDEADEGDELDEDDALEDDEADLDEPEDDAAADAGDEA